MGKIVPTTGFGYLLDYVYKIFTKVLDFLVLIGKNLIKIFTFIPMFIQLSNLLDTLRKLG